MKERRNVGRTGPEMGDHYRSEVVAIDALNLDARTLTLLCGLFYAGFDQSFVSEAIGLEEIVYSIGVLLT